MKIKECAELLKTFDNIHIYTHIHPDGDALGSSYALSAALKKLGKRVKVVCLDTLPEYLSFIWKNVGEEDFEPDFIVTSDVADMSLLGEFGNKKIDLVIDHHLKNSLPSENKLVLPEMAATGEIIYELILELQLELDNFIADCLYTAISTDTGCFKFSNATAHTFKTVGELTAFTPSGNFGYLNLPLFIVKSKNKLKFESELIQSLDFLFDGKVSVLVVTDEVIKKHSLTDSDTGGVEQLGKSIEGVELALTFKERKGGFKVSLRSSDSIDASLIASHFGGGGHRCAAGCFIEGERDFAVNALISHIKEEGIII